MRKQSPDKTDIAIIGHLQVDGRRAYTTIAKDLGISEASVRQRVARLLRTNIIQIVAVSSPLDLGLIWAQVHLRVEGERLEAVAEEVARRGSGALLALLRRSCSRSAATSWKNASPR